MWSKEDALKTLKHLWLQLLLMMTLKNPTFVRIRQSSVPRLKRVANLPMAALVAVLSKMLFVARMDNIAVHQVCRSNHFHFQSIQSRMLY